MSMPIAESERGHRRGVVLGFTMAELLMLLLFCLLLVSATSLMQKQKQIDALQVQAGAGAIAPGIPDKAGQLNALLMALFPGGVPNLTPLDMSKLWETLVLARNQNVGMTSVGVKSEQDFEQMLAVWRDVSATAASPEEIANLIAMMEKLQQAGAGNLTPDQLQAVVAGVSNEAGVAPGDRWPPFISLDSNKYRFQTGSAEITPAFESYLTNEAASKIADLLLEYDGDVIEIVGHTDEQVIEPKEQTVSNMDKLAIAAVNGQTQQPLVPVDNAGLGLARAIEVARVLRAQPGLEGIKVVPLSAGQLMQKGDLLSSGGQVANDPDRRRIEIRIRRSTTATE